MLRIRCLPPGASRASDFFFRTPSIKKDHVINILYMIVYIYDYVYVCIFQYIHILIYPLLKPTKVRQRSLPCSGGRDMASYGNNEINTSEGGREQLSETNENSTFIKCHRKRKVFFQNHHFLFSIVILVFAEKYLSTNHLSKVLCDWFTSSKCSP